MCYNVTYFYNIPIFQYVKIIYFYSICYKCLNNITNLFLYLREIYVLMIIQLSIHLLNLSEIVIPIFIFNPAQLENNNYKSINL